VKVINEFYYSLGQLQQHISEPNSELTHIDSTHLDLWYQNSH